MEPRNAGPTGTTAPEPLLLIASDHAGTELKSHLIDLLKPAGRRLVDLGPAPGGTSVDYPDYAARVASRVSAGEGLGVLICGTGIGMSMAANRFSGVRAALVSCPWLARMAREHNDANVLVLGGRVMGRALAEQCLLSWLGASFQGGRHQRRIDKIEELDEGGRG